MRDVGKELLRQFKDKPNYIVSSGCDVPPGTPMKNVYAFYDAVNEFNVK